MLNIYTDSEIDEVKKTIEGVEGLLSAVNVLDIQSLDRSTFHIIISHDHVYLPMPWHNLEAPIAFKPKAYPNEEFIAIILAKLSYLQEALDFTTTDELRNEILCMAQLLNGEQKVSIDFTQSDYFALHNQALLTHYTPQFHNGVTCLSLYEKAIKAAPDKERAAFSAKHMAIAHLDQGNFEQAEALLRLHLSSELPEDARFSLKRDLINTIFEQLSAPYDQPLLEEAKDLIWTTIAYYEKHEASLVVAPLLVQASELANIGNSYSESLSLINKAIGIYEEEEVADFLASAFLRKGTLLYTWAQNGNPQFYQTAIDTYNEALKVFTRENYPPIHAEIHHNLAVIYAEMPAEEKKKAMWAAFSATSFKECLAFYNKEQYPYEYSMIANNYGNALMKYPPAKTGDNVEKAIYYYMESLEIRNAGEFPVERVHTILNYLEACWRVHNVNKNMELTRCKDMIARAKEVKQLTDDTELLQQAEAHLTALNKLSISLMMN
ncbi:MAG: hypothetical protein Roseis2KO_16140 [Roseivirga sp.]